MKDLYIKYNKYIPKEYNKDNILFFRCKNLRKDDMVHFVIHK